MARTTRQRLIDAAQELFYRQGFLAVGLDRILREVGVTKTTFYNHFESKDDLILAVLHEHDRWWQRTLVELLEQRGGRSPRKQLLAMFDVLEAIFQDEGYRGCLFVNVAVEFPLAHDPAHEAASASKRGMEEIIRKLAARAGAFDAGAFAEEFCLVVEGAFVLRQVVGKPETARIAQRLGRMLIAKYLPADLGEGRAELDGRSRVVAVRT